MASIWGNYLRARESAYFKVEQEAAVQERRDKLEKEGKLQAVKAAKTSEQVYETLSEILQAEARVYAPNASLAKRVEVRLKALPEPPTREEIRRVRMALMGTKFALATPQKLTLGGRHRYDSIANMLEMIEKERAESTRVIQRHSKETLELAQRSYAVGVRSLVYGSLAGLVFCTVAAVAAVRYFDISSGEDLKVAFQEQSTPYVIAARMKGESLKSELQAYIPFVRSTSSTDEASANSRSQQVAKSQFQLRLRRMYQPDSYSD